jgi:NhaA family Na+:H+ antiporter
MSLFIAGQAFPDAADFAAAKTAVFLGSAISAILGVALLYRAPPAASAQAESLSTPVR